VDKLIRLVFAPVSWTYSYVLGFFSNTSVFFDDNYLPWVKDLESHWPTIRAEFDHVLATTSIPSFADVVPGEAKIADAKWKMYIFRIFSTEIPENCVRCPKTYALIKDIPGMTSAYFSIIDAGKHIPAHCGPFRGVIRYHLGVKIPAPAEKCRIRVADQTRSWEEGKSLIFDDTYDHEVWNDTDDFRAVLFMDIMRPLPAPIRWVNDFTYFIISRLLVRNMFDREKGIVR